MFGQIVRMPIWNRCTPEGGADRSAKMGRTNESTTITQTNRCAGRRGRAARSNNGTGEDKKHRIKREEGRGVAPRSQSPEKSRFGKQAREKGGAKKRGIAKKELESCSLTSEACSAKRYPKGYLKVKTAAVNKTRNS